MELHPHIPRNRSYHKKLEYRDLGTKSVNRYTDRETVSRIATFGKCQPYCQTSLMARGTPQNWGPGDRQRHARAAPCRHRRRARDRWHRRAHRRRRARRRRASCASAPPPPAFHFVARGVEPSVLGFCARAVAAAAAVADAAAAAAARSGAPARAAPAPPPPTPPPPVCLHVL